ncbi:Gar1/Naf1 RNA binding region-domain-containing protein [Desarmillaria tabescens]|uniref:H/ACA ribonucleoprotein complex subunit n=1 Tax=Armillaria tabescens TaxID=1929756 RepID=A0AA39N6S0_ARMTA|nr:Gar1/Naf1 RNA binding region-domain-containing protein [Desarmillaria tabescens]KAK0459469.1 Gar1/Naf1 RNA binding region-domain-containing protein [Desarmillaria tabescens]
MYRGNSRGGSSRGGARGGRGGGRGGFQQRDMGPPDTVLEMGTFVHAVEDEMLCSSLLPDKVPYFNAPIYLQNKSVIGKVDEILGPINEVYFSIKMGEGMVASSFQKGDKVYIGGDKLLPIERFLPKPKVAGGALSCIIYSKATQQENGLSCPVANISLERGRGGRGAGAPRGRGAGGGRGGFQSRGGSRGRGGTRGSFGGGGRGGPRGASRGGAGAGGWGARGSGGGGRGFRGS